jgi:type I phosphodiesterase/nucleotide pyrophosphatase
MVKNLIASAVGFAGLDLLAVVCGDPTLVSFGGWRLVALLWGLHLAFWILCLGLIAPPFLAVARGGRTVRGDRTLALLCVGAATFAFVLPTFRYFVPRDLGFFTVPALSTSLALYAASLVLAAFLFRVLRDRAEGLERLRPGIAATGIALAALACGRLEWESPSGRTGSDPGATLAAVRSGPAAAPAGARHRVVLLALDGADWQVIDPLIEKGGLPRFALLKRDGATAALQTISPASPVIWTSIATGVSPERHSVQDFTEIYSSSLRLSLPRLRNNFAQPLLTAVGLFEKVPVSSATRTALALWDLLGDAGGESLVVNWWASYPADTMRGLMISDMAIPMDEISLQRISRMKSVAGRVYPEKIWPEVLSVMREAVSPGSPGAGPLGFIADRKVLKKEFWEARDRIAFSLFQRFDERKFILSALYLKGIDTSSHHYSQRVFGRSMDLERPPMVGPEVVAEERAHVEAVYAWMDGIVGSLMDKLEDGDLLAVVSDHGWRYDGTGHHGKPDGILALYGSEVRPGLSSGRLHVYDVAPTLLSYLGVPMSADMPGKVLEECFLPAAGRSLAREVVASFGPRARRERGTIAGTAEEQSDLDDEYLKMLKSLGYVE